MQYMLFERSFVPGILSRRKRISIRGCNRIANYRPGASMSLRHWADLAYRSKQLEFAVARILSIHICRISAAGIVVDGERCRPHRRSAIARLDGFDNWPAMRAWFASRYVLPYTGVMIEWALLSPSNSSDLFDSCHLVCRVPQPSPPFCLSLSTPV